MKTDSELVRVSDDQDILHIVSCHSVGGTLRASEVPHKNVVVWFDSLTVGPAPGAHSLEHMSRIRNRYMRKPPRWRFLEKGWDSPSFAKRDDILRHCSKWREVALWFGASVIEQFSLLQILAALDEQNIGRTRLSLVSSHKHAMGIYRPEQLPVFFRSRGRIPARDRHVAARAWQLYCSPDPIPLFRFAKRGLRSQPLLRRALLLQLEQYPSLNSGLSFSETALLQAVEERRTVVRGVAQVLGMDNEYRTGDYELFDAMGAFLHAKVPLIETENNVNIQSFAEFAKLQIRLTPAGRDVLSGSADQVALSGIDRWIGGVHLKGNTVRWRWDSKNHSLRRTG
jgi:hypothetical protein